MRRGLVSAIILVGFFACTDPADIRVAPTAPQLAKGAAGTSVSSATPAYGRQGAMSQQVTITGSGFASGDVAKWERGGVPNAKVVVTSTQFVSSTQLIATIDIAADADLAFYDIAIYAMDRKKGIGTEMFEVTTAESIGSLGGNTNANGANDNGEVVGYSVAGNSGQHAFYWSVGSGMVDIGGSDAFAIDQAGTTIVGVGAGYPLRWTRGGIGSPWTSSVLPLDATAVGGRAAALASDPVTGVATIIGGQEIFAVKQAQIHNPRLWKNVAGTWQKVDLPMPFASQTGTISWVAAVNANGQASGAARPGGGGAAQAIFWEETGVPLQYQLKVLGDGGAPAINSTGTIIAGSNNNFTAVYYKRSPGGAWSTAQVLPGGCTGAVGVDASDRIAANGCPIP
ncbi:MAG TPA: hypothetical protein VM076_09745, partial [Gemmatimonadaceae bacterium]|nr:hypothetical protein [Gemmatimonadaceae bacterium]